MTLDQKKKQLNTYTRYSGMGFQMLGIILAGVFAGYFLDKWLHTSPLMVLILSLSSVVLAIYTVTKDLFRKK